MPATTAQLDLSIWRNDDVYELPLRVIGPNLTSVSMRAQIRMSGDSPALLAGLELVTNGNAEGIRLASAAQVDGRWVNDVRIRLNKSTRQALPYAGELGDAWTGVWVLAIAGKTRITGRVQVLAHALDSDAAPLSRPPSYGLPASQAGTPISGATLTIASDDVVELVIDGADLVGQLVTSAKRDADRAVAAANAAAANQSLSEAARDAALATGQTFPTVAAGLAGTVPSSYFIVPGTGNMALSLYLNNNGAAVLQAAFPSLQGISVYGTVPAIARDTQQDQAAAINEAFANSDVREIIVPDGIFSIARTVEVPAGKKLLLGSASILQALPTFAIIGDKNHGVLLMGDRSEIAGGTVDMNKRGLGEGINARYNGITVLTGAQNCIRRDVMVKNCTGYGVYDRGDQIFARPPSSHNYNVRTENCEIHFEPQGAVGTTYLDCHARDGDGDVQVSSYFHPLVGSTDISFISCSAKGKAPAGFEISANIRDLRNIRIVDTIVELEGGIALVVSNGYNKAYLKVSGSRFTSDVQLAASMSQAFGEFSSTTFNGKINAITQNDCDLDYEGCSVKAVNDINTSQFVVGLQAYGGSARFNGGRIITAHQGSGSETVRGPVRVSSDTLQVPAAATGPSRTKLTDASGDVALQGNGASQLFQVVSVGRNITDITKCVFMPSLRSTDGALSPAYGMTWAWIGSDQIRIDVNAVGAIDPTKLRLNWSFVEFE